MNQTKTYDELIAELQALANPMNVEGQKRFAIYGGIQLGVSLYDLRRMAKGIRDHELAQRLWDSGLHEGRLLASLVDDPHLVTIAQMNAWVDDFESWDICDQATDNLFIHADGILDLIPQWAMREEEFVRRAAFATIAAIAWNRKDISDEIVAGFIPLIEAKADDPRNFVKKAVNWALRNIGKRRPALRQQAVECARRLSDSTIPSARWIGRDALKEFETKFGPDL
ncbi:DNA alkylation repair protein [bacterium]|nr:MAG: DNA alkylation repair protein [bacterium]